MGEPPPPASRGIGDRAMLLGGWISGLFKKAAKPGAPALPLDGSAKRSACANI